MNFSPSFCKISRLEWSEFTIKAVSRIKKQYEFNKNYDLLKALEKAVNWYEVEKDVQAQDVSPKQSREMLTNLIECLEKTREIPELMEKLGTKNRDALIDYFIENRSLAQIEAFGELEDEIMRRMPLIDKTIAACNYVVKNLPPSKSGPKSNSSLTKRFIPLLANIFEEGTGEEPKCEWDTVEGKIFPECIVHLFIIEIAKILKREVSIDLVSESSIEKYVKDYWQLYKTRKLKKESHI